MKADKLHFQLLFGAIPFALGTFALLGAPAARRKRPARKRSEVKE